MTKINRLFLLLNAVMWAGIFYWALMSFSKSVESRDQTMFDYLFCLGAGIIVAIPFWVCILIPNTYYKLLKVSKVLCAVMIIPHFCITFPILFHNINRFFSGLSISFSAITIAIVLIICCLSSWYILLKKQ